MINIYADLPKIVKVDSYESRDGAICPHCGAEGKNIIWFTVEGGKKHGAMAGCFSKFKMHPFAKMTANLLKKQSEYQQKGWKLPSWDLEILEAINRFVNGDITEGIANSLIGLAQARAAEYRSRKR